MQPRVPSLILGSVAVLAGLGIWLWSGTQEAASTKPLHVYVAAGLREPMTKIAEEYEKETGVKVQFTFDGSGTLLASIRASGEGDLFLAADREYLVKAEEFKLTGETMPIAKQHPVIAVAKGNPKGIKAIADLLRDDVRLTLPNPETAAIGKVAQKLLAKEKLNDQPAWDALFAKKVVARDTVNAVANDIKTGTADAGIIWDTTASQYAEFELIEVPEFSMQASEIALAVLKSSKDSAAAERFARFIVAADRGMTQWKKFGYETIPGPDWKK